MTTITSSPTLQRIAMKTILYYAFLMAGVTFIGLVLLLTIYLVVSFTQRGTMPASFNIEIPSSAKPGDIMDIKIANIYRTKICHYDRNVIVTDSNNRSWGYGNISQYPPLLLGKNPDIDLPLVLDKNTAPGLAMFSLTVEYRCPGNVIQYYYPFVYRFYKQFNVTQ